ncbi:MAG: MFS transporter [Solirubrobacteraceae bacterium]|nr:MFS transporter [Solirubrobacteraceae bacterium]
MSPGQVVTARDRYRVLAVVCAALLMVVIDATVLHIAAPAIGEDLRPTSVELLWIIDAYPLVVAPLLVGFAKLGDKVGRPQVMQGGLVVFAIGSLVAAFAPDAMTLIVARGIMGVGGAMIMPQTMSVLRDVFPDRAERTRAVGIWVSVSSAGAAIGPIVGGFLVEHFWWGSVFLINIPVIVAIGIATVTWLPPSRAANPAPLDPVSVAQITLAILGLAFGFKHGARFGFADPVALVTLIGGAVLLGAFVRRQLAAAVPLLDVRLFAGRTFTVAVGCIVLSMVALIGLDFFFAQYLQLVLGLSPVAASIRLMPLVIATVVGGLIAAPILARTGTRATIAGGLLVTSLSLVPLLGLGEQDTWLTMSLCFVVLGLGIQVVAVAANDVIISAVTTDRSGDAAAIEETAYELGGGIGIAVLGSVVAAVYSDALEKVPAVPSGARESLSEAVEIAKGLPEAAGAALEQAAQLAFVDALHVAIAASLGVMVFATVVAALTLDRHAAAAVEEPDELLAPTGGRAML